MKLMLFEIGPSKKKQTKNSGCKLKKGRKI